MINKIMALKLLRYFYLLMEKPLVATSKFDLLNISQHGATMLTDIKEIKLLITSPRNQKN